MQYIQPKEKIILSEKWFCNMKSHYNFSDCRNSTDVKAQLFATDVRRARQPWNRHSTLTMTSIATCLNKFDILTRVKFFPQPLAPERGRIVDALFIKHKHPMIHLFTPLQNEISRLSSIASLIVLLTDCAHCARAFIEPPCAPNNVTIVIF